MLDITIFAVTGDVKWIVVLSYVGVGGGHWHIDIDKGHHGSIFKRRGEWTFATNHDSELTTDDLQLIAQIIDEYIRVLWESHEAPRVGNNWR